ncbi:MAG: 3-hydroxyacyl-CoA dehydrogenase NAD-binding domain-containing protein [Pseudomonadota bacterium]
MSRVAPSEVTTAAILGMGSVGAGWAALMLAKGIALRAFDPMPDAETRAKRLITGSWPSINNLGQSGLAAPPFDGLRFFETAQEAAAGADVIIEAVPEDLDMKRPVIAAAETAGPEVPILSSAGGIPPSRLQEGCAHPERVLVVHPFNPSHLIPLVEIVPGAQTAPAVVAWARDFARHLGKKPITLNAELPGHMVNRLQFALIREAVACLVNGVASPEDIDAAVRYGLAPRWLLQGALHTVAMAGGPGGMHGILDHAGPAMERWWAPSEGIAIDAPTKDKLAAAAARLNQDAEFAEWAAWRDAELVSVLTRQAEADAQRPGGDAHV